jgi:hypothetical protein
MMQILFYFDILNLKHAILVFAKKMSTIYDYTHKLEVMTFKLSNSSSKKRSKID